MAIGPLGSVLRQLRRRLAAPADDAGLLRRFADRRDDVAFAALVERHGSLVWNVCRRVLGHEHDAEDAFQATFLVLAKKAASVRSEAALGAWLYEVAYHIALRARAASARRARHERQAADMAPAQPTADTAWDELRPALDEELHRLPERYRRLLVLYYLQGRTYRQAAAELGMPAGSVARHLGRARELLRERLRQRGVALAGGLLAAVLAEKAGAAAWPAALLPATVRAAALFAAGRTAGVPAQAAALAEGALKALTLSRLKTTVALVVALTALAAGTGYVAYRALTTKPAAAAPGADDESAGAEERPAAPLPDGAVRRLGTTRLRHGGPVAAVAFSPDGRLLASGGHDEVVRLWDPATGRPRGVLAAGVGGVRSVAFAPDGKTLAAAGDGFRHQVCLWDLAAGKPALRLEASRPGLNQGVEAVAFAPDGKTLATAGKDGLVQLWDVATGRVRHALSAGRFPADAVAFSPKGDLLAACGYDGLVRLWDPATGQEVRSFRPGRDKYQAHSVAFSPDGRTVVVAGSDFGPAGEGPGQAPRAVYVWDVATGQEVPQPGGDRGRCAAAAAYSPDGKALVTAYPNKALAVWDVAEGRLLQSLRMDPKTKEVLALRGDGTAGRPPPAVWGPHSGADSVYGIALSADGKYLAAAGHYNTVHLWDLAGGRLLHQGASAPAGPIHAVALAPDGRTLATAAGDRSIGLWDLGTGRQVGVLWGHDGPVHALAFGPDGRHLASGGADGTARLWDVGSGHELRRLCRDDVPVSHVAFAPDGQTLAVAHGAPDPPAGRKADADPAANRLRLWDWAAGKLLHALEAECRTVALAFTPDGRAVTAAGADGAVRAWRAATGEPLARSSLRGGDVPLEAAAFAPDGRTAASSDQSGDTVLLWEAGADKPWARLVIPGSRGHLLAFAPDGRFLATAPAPARRPVAPPDWRAPAAADQAVRLWELASGKEVLHFTPPPGSEVSALAFAPDGRALITGLKDAAALVWDLVPAWPIKPDVHQPWADLASADAQKAYRAAHALARSKEAAALVQKELPPAAADPKQVEKHISDLESDDFAARDRAAAELEKLADLAEPALRRKLGERPPLETRRRVEALLDKARGPVTSPERLRALRAVAVLERAGTPEAVQTLRRLAGGAPEARLTREARAALGRLGQRSLRSATES